jgi:hypothetical protein
MVAEDYSRPILASEGAGDHERYPRKRLTELANEGG